MEFSAFFGQFENSVTPSIYDSEGKKWFISIIPHVVFFLLDPIKNRKMNNASRVVYADDEEMHHSLLVTQRGNFRLELTKGWVRNYPVVFQKRARTNEKWRCRNPPATGYISFLERIFSDRSCNRHELFVWKNDKQWKLITRTKGLIPNNCM